ncbi:dNTP triphosphohydrolase [Komagataeibacter nataicola]|nr:dNTP triphosphohydrolase [Komagataeibacter nataicola]WNM08245.1 dNTP triphosphohydrolase [Komagataeibacter nataicola]
MGDVTPAQQVEFNAFEGNAQGFRILTRTEMYRNKGGMRLALGSLGAFTKYPVSAPVRLLAGAEGVMEGMPYIGLKKYGFFENDVPTFAHVAAELGLGRTDVRNASGQVVGSWWRRHPLAFLMEAADDICYNIMDLEDAYLSEDISFEVATDLLGALTARSRRDYPERSLADIVSIYRAKAISGAIGACVDAFRENYAAIMAGTFPRSLVEASRLGAEFQAIRHVARTEIFNAARKTELEVYGRNVVYRILDGLLPLLNELRAVDWNSSRLSAYHAQVVRALRLPVAHVTNAYDALHALTDFVSGMTDRYAVKVADIVGRR